ncbi:MAG: outer membrane protein assembly factor BamD [Gemmatimonadetes bacterium]|nr:outer membrane protein assembly factor BamD [Gemmatimonadota bacterium]
MTEPGTSGRMGTSRTARLDWRFLVLLGFAATMVGCGRGFQPRDFATPEALFRASLLEFERKHWEDAQAGFEKLTNDLSARDPLLAPAFYWLALTHERRHEYLLAAQAFERLTDGFPEDTLAPAAMLGTGRAYQSLWRRPVLDPEQGQKAASILRALLSSYPDAKEGEEAKRRIAQLEEWFAEKDYLIGVHYQKVRRSVDPAIIYYKDVVQTYPSTKAARLAWLRLHELYKKIRWTEDAAETCTAMWKAYPGDAEVTGACGKAPADTTVRATGSPQGAPGAVAATLPRPAPRGR